jgi:hypothetical protein
MIGIGCRAPSKEWKGAATRPQSRVNGAITYLFIPAATTPGEMKASDDLSGPALIRKACKMGVSRYGCS